MSLQCIHLCGIGGKVNQCLRPRSMHLSLECSSYITLDMQRYATFASHLGENIYEVPAPWGACRCW